MKKYVLLHKDLILCYFEMQGSEVTCWIIMNDQQRINHLPLPLKRVIHFINGGYLEKFDGKAFYINEEGRYLLEAWLSDRAIPINRENITKYTRTRNTLELMLDNKSCSLTDCYWTKELNGESISWNQAKLFDSGKIQRLEVVIKHEKEGKQYASTNATLGGQLEKFWYYNHNSETNKNTLMLAKKTTVANNILSIREIIASEIYKKQGYRNYCKYEYIRNRYKQVVGCKCRAFTKEKLELITAYDLLEEYGLTQTNDTVNKIIECANRYGADVNQVRNQLDIQTFVDYLITNRDRHQNNIGFLRDPDTLEIIKIAPIFDSGSCIDMEGQLPLGVINTTVHNLYNTELDCLNSTSNIHAINLDKLPAKKWIEKQYSYMFNSNPYTIKTYIDLYIAKLDYLKQIQQGG